MDRPQVSVFIAASMDGFIAASDGSIAFLDCVQAPGEDYGFGTFFAGIDTVVLGRNTWETTQGFSQWPFTGKQVTVLSHRPLAATHGESVHAGPLAPLLERLRESGARRIYLDGGAAIRQGLAEGVIDDMTLSTIPVLLGKGRPLFGAEAGASGWPGTLWRLAGIDAFPSGLVQCRWQRTPPSHLPY
ncbi:MAG: dihydrofolate reductase family protein [Pseudomonadota bacterium]